MKCSETIKKLSSYLSNELSLDDEYALKSHLDQCSECNEYYQKLKETLQYLKPTQDIKEDVFYYTRLKQKMENKIYNPIKSSLISLVVRSTLYSASIIFAVFIGIQIGSYTESYKQLSDLNPDDSYIKVFSDKQYFNDFDLETVESTLINEENTNNE